MARGWEEEVESRQGEGVVRAGKGSAGWWWWVGFDKIAIYGTRATMGFTLRGDDPTVSLPRMG